MSDEAKGSHSGDGKSEDNVPASATRHTPRPEQRGTFKNEGYTIPVQMA